MEDFHFPRAVDAVGDVLAAGWCCALCSVCRASSRLAGEVGGRPTSLACSAGQPPACSWVRPEKSKSRWWSSCVGGNRLLQWSLHTHWWDLCLIFFCDLKWEFWISNTLVSCILICCKMEGMGHIFTLQSLLQVNSSKHHHCSLTRTPEGNQRCPRFYSDHGTTTSTNSSSSELSQFVKDWRRGLTTQRSQQLLLNPQAPTAPTCET